MDLCRIIFLFSDLITKEALILLHNDDRRLFEMEAAPNNRNALASLIEYLIGVKTGQESSRTNRHRFPYFLPVPVLVGKIRNMVGNRSKGTRTGTGLVLQFSRPFFWIPLVTREFPDFPGFLPVSKLQTSTLTLSPLYISLAFAVVNGWARWD